MLRLGSKHKLITTDEAPADGQESMDQTRSMYLYGVLRNIEGDCHGTSLNTCLFWKMVSGDGRLPELDRL